MKTELITSWPEFDRLAPDWNDLLFRTEAASVFLTWEWISAWRKVLRDSVDPFVIVVRSEAGALIGIAPLYVSHLLFLKTISYHTLRYIADSASGAEYPDWIVDPEREEEVCLQIAETLAAESSLWDAMWLPRIASWTGARRRIYESIRSTGLPVRVRDGEFTYLDLPEDIEAFEFQFSRKRRQALRRNTRKIRALENSEFCRCTSEEEIPVYLSGLFDLHQKRWRAAGMDGVFVRKPAMAKAFYETFAPQAFSNGWLRIFGLKVGGQFKAVQYGYEMDRIYMQLQEGYDPDFELGAGNALRHVMIEKLMEQGVRTYDFLGGYSEHKRRWGGEVRLGCDVFVGSQSLKGKLLLSSGVWPSGRYVDQLGPGISDQLVTA